MGNVMLCNETCRDDVFDEMTYLSQVLYSLYIQKFISIRAACSSPRTYEKDVLLPRCNSAVVN